MGKNIEQIKYVVIDVDGTMTDGGIYYDSSGNEIKKFNTRDAAAFFAAHAVGIKTVVVTGRCCEATMHRLTELSATYLFQNVGNKYIFLKNFFKEQKITSDEVAYIGDDLNDLEGMSLAGYVACPFDACKEVKGIADYVSNKCGGNGAVRDVIEHLLSKQGKWDLAVNNVYYSEKNRGFSWESKIYLLESLTSVKE